MTMVNYKVCLDNTLVWCLILEYLGINWLFFKEIHQSFMSISQCIISNDSFVAWPIKTAMATPEYSSIIIVRKIGSGKPGYDAV